MFQAGHFRQGDPLDPANRLGVLVSEAHYTKVKSYLDLASKDGMTPLMGSVSADDRTITPTIFGDVSHDHVLAREEIFGPVMGIVGARSTDEAVAMANDTSYGLAASVFSASIGPALRSARAINAGTVTVNCYGEGDITTPFGGFRESGFGGRDNGLAAHDQFTETKTIWVDLNDYRDEDLIDG